MATSAGGNRTGYGVAEGSAGSGKSGYQLDVQATPTVNLAGRCAAPAPRGADEAAKARLPEGDEVLFVGPG